MEFVNQTRVHEGLVRFKQILNRQITDNFKLTGPEFEVAMRRLDPNHPHLAEYGSSSGKQMSADTAGLVQRLSQLLESGIILYFEDETPEYEDLREWVQQKWEGNFSVDVLQFENIADKFYLVVVRNATQRADILAGSPICSDGPMVCVFPWEVDFNHSYFDIKDFPVRRLEFQMIREWRSEE